MTAVMSIEQTLKERYKAARLTIWPMVKKVKAPSPEELAMERRRESALAKAARIEAYRRSLAEADMLSRLERDRLAMERREQRQREHESRRIARKWPSWAEISKGIDFSDGNDAIVASILRHFSGMTFESLIRDDHRRRVSAARSYVMYALFMKIGNQSEVGRIMRRDHSTVNSSVQKVRREIGE